MARIAGVLCAGLLVWGCAEPQEGSGPVAATPATTPASTPAITPLSPAQGQQREWVAVFLAAEIHDEGIAALTEDLMRKAPKNLAVSPIECWPGLAESMGVDAGLYAASVVAASRDELTDVVESVGRTPVHTGEYETMCTD